MISAAAAATFYPKGRHAMSLLQLAFLASAMGTALSAIMAVAWQVQRSTGHTGWIDVCWTFGTGIVAALGSLAPLPSDHSTGARQIMVAVLIALWSLRLGAHILVRTREAGDDPRYRELISQWGARADLRMFLQLQSQAAVGLILALSVALAAHNTRPGLGLSDFLGLALLVGALAGEAVSDWQLRRFRSDPANHGRICEAGLMEPVTPSELLLRMALLACLSADRNRSVGVQSARLVDAGGASLHVLGAGACLRHSTAGGAHAALARRTISGLAGAHAAVFSFPQNVVRTSDRQLGRQPEARCGRDRAEQRSPTCIDHCELRGPVPQRRLVGEVVGHIGEEAEQCAAKCCLSEASGLQRRKDCEDH